MHAQVSSRVAVETVMFAHIGWRSGYVHRCQRLCSRQKPIVQPTEEVSLQTESKFVIFVYLFHIQENKLFCFMDLSVVTVRYIGPSDENHCEVSKESTSYCRTSRTHSSQTLLAYHLQNSYIACYKTETVNNLTNKNKQKIFETNAHFDHDIYMKVQNCPYKIRSCRLKVIRQGVV